MKSIRDNDFRIILLHGNDNRLAVFERVYVRPINYSPDPQEAKERLVFSGNDDMIRRRSYFL